MPCPGLRVAFLFGVVCAGTPWRLAGESLAPAWERVARGVEYSAFAIGDPRSEIHALRVDLDEADLVVTPAGPSFGQVIGRSVLEFAHEFDCVAAVNATPFYPESWRRGEPRWLSGILVAKGVLQSAAAAHFWALVVGADGLASVRRQGTLGDLASLRYAVGGFFPLLLDGNVVARKSARQPMTAAGILRGGKGLVFIVVDGRRPGSAGMNEEEAARLLLALGARDGLSFDGGGSSAMALRGSDGRTRMVNLPTRLGVPPLERVVGTCVGFRPR
jgi:hypothetical protein